MSEAPDLTESAIRSALEQGHAYVSHDWMCDATGFSFVLEQTAGSGSNAAKHLLMGDEAAFTGGQTLRGAFPVRCHARLLRDGKVIDEVDNDKFVHSLSEPGVYRLEGWLKLDGEERPWIYSNPIYVR